MSTRGPADVEQLLRRTYAEVAARTTIEAAVPDGEARVVPLRTDRGRGWRPVVAAAAVVALVVAGLLALAGRDGDEPAGLGDARHAVPGYIPHTDAVETGRPFPLVEISSTDASDRVRYATDGASVTIETLRDGTSFPAGEAVAGRSDADAVRADRTIWWPGPAGSVVAVSWTGVVPAGVIDDVVAGIVYVDDETWIELTSHGGFRQPAEDEPLLRFRIDADEDFDIELVGNLHDGLSLRIGPIGWGLPLADCGASENYEVADLRDRSDADPTRIGYFVLVPGSQTVVDVTIEGDRVDVPLTSLRPAVDVEVGGFVVDGRSLGDGAPVVSCSEAAP